LGGASSLSGVAREAPVTNAPPVLGCGLAEPARTIATVIHLSSRPFSVRRSATSDAV